jgi:hypothetical protein
MNPVKFAWNLRAVIYICILSLLIGSAIFFEPPAPKKSHLIGIASCIEPEERRDIFAFGSFWPPDLVPHNPEPGQDIYGPKVEVV